MPASQIEQPDGASDSASTSTAASHPTTGDGPVAKRARSSGTGPSHQNSGGPGGPAAGRGAGANLAGDDSAAVTAEVLDIAVGAEDPDTARSWESAEYRESVVELLGLLACGEFLAFERLVTEAQVAPTLSQRVRVAWIAAGELAHCNLLRQRLVAMGEDPDEVMEIFAAPLEQFHSMTAPTDWLEGLVKAYVGDSIAIDFYREMAKQLDPQTRALVMEVCAELGQTEVVLEEVRAAIAADPRVAGRLALWGRRLLGEALSQAQAVAAEREPLVRLVLGDEDIAGFGLTDGPGLMDRLIGAHVARMTALGLSA